MIPADVKCVGRTGYRSDDLVCPLRDSCLRHTEIPTEPSRATWVMHLCRSLANEAFIAAVGETDLE